MQNTLTPEQGNNQTPQKGQTMKKLIVEAENEGLVSLLGERVQLWCDSYIYAGILAGVNDTCVLLDDPRVIYETGPLNHSGFKNEEKPLASQIYVQVAKIESFSVVGVVS